ncbi:MAG TPA: aldehyde dehydrogenase [Myxococcales bacterium]|nr:aldehyde dehydrogenase [Myxococcales bacterium]
MTIRIQTRSPVDGSVYVERALADASQIESALAAAERAQLAWRRVDLADRVQALEGLVAAFVADKAAIAEELTWQMGRPRSQTPGEVGGFEHRARTMLSLAPSALADVVPPNKMGFERFIRREPLGVVLCLAPWNYPYLCAVNAVIPALAAGNAVVLKHSDQTPLCAERIVAAGQAAGLPSGLLQFLHCSHPQVADIIRDPRIDFVAFTGSVEGGRAVSAAASQRFIGLGLELGGKDPAYVRADADLDHAIPNLVEGVCFNSGQSCCGVERIYVHEDVYDQVVEGYVAQVKGYRLGNPLDPQVDLGPLVRDRAADHVRQQIRQAIALGARGLVDPGHFPAHSDTGAYLAPQVLVDVNHDMDLMREETFGPAVGIMKVGSDEEAIDLMNESRFGLTASLWTEDLDEAQALGDRLQTGTVFMNRCDYLDPELAWVGVKDSGRGCTLSSVGFESLTRPKSFHLRQL